MTSDMYVVEQLYKWRRELSDKLPGFFSAPKDMNNIVIRLAYPVLVQRSRLHVVSYHGLGAESFGLTNNGQSTATACALNSNRKRAEKNKKTRRNVRGRRYLYIRREIVLYAWGIVIIHHNPQYGFVEMQT